tara:strand:- start:20524 stop:24930 length:4407 start_codon:yes stop_codon:yes gene_type:complete
LYFIAAILLLVILLWGLFQIPTVQTFAAQKVSDFLSKELKNEIKIERLSIDFFNAIDLKEIYISDQNQDTLVSLKQAKVSIGVLSLKENYLNLDLKLTEPYFNLYRKKEDSLFNHQFIIDYFSSSQNKNSVSWSIDLDETQIVNGRFSYHDYHKSDSNLRTVNYSHIDLSKIYLNANDAQVVGGNIYASIQQLSFVEANGFELKNLATDLSVERELLDFQNTIIQTAKTELDADIRFMANSFADYNQFIDLVHLSTTFRNSLVSMDDIAFFASPLDGIEEQVYLDGRVNGTISNLKGESIEIHVNKETVLIGDFNLKGLPDIQNTYIFLELDEFRTTANGIRQLPYPPFNEKNHLTVPENIDRLGTISFRGNFTGFYNDFVATGKVNSALGSVETDLALKEKESQLFTYKGSVSSSGFNVGQFLDVNQLGNVAFQLDVDGQGVTKKTVQAKAEGKLQKLEFQDYTYRDVNLNGSFTNQKFEGSIGMKDKNLAFDFNGVIDAVGEQLISDFELDVKKAKLAQLNLYNREDSLTEVSFETKINLIGFDFDEVRGNLRIDSLKYLDSDTKLQLVDSLIVSSEKENDLRFLKLQSSLMNGEMSGVFKLNELHLAINSILENYLPNNNYQKPKELQKFDYKIVFRETEPITKVLLEDFTIDSGAVLSGSVNSNRSAITAKLTANKVFLKSHEFKNVDFSINSNSDSLKSSLTTSSYRFFGFNSLDSFQLDAQFHQGNFNLRSHWDGINQEVNYGQLQVDAFFHDFDSLEAQFVNSYISIEDSIWTIDSSNLVSIDGKNIDIQNFHLFNEAQDFRLNGKISEQADDSLELEIQNLNLSYLALLLPEESIKMSGIGDGNLLIKDAYNNFTLTSDLQFDSLKLNEVYIGEAYFKSDWLPGTSVLDVQGRLGKKSDNILVIDGEVHPKRKSESLNLDLVFNDFPIVLLEPYIDEYLTDLSGTTSGTVEVNGEASKPLLKGKLMLNKAGMRVNMLNTTYTITDEVIIQPDFIGVNNIKIVDENGSEAYATGTVFHNNYSDLSLDIGLEYNNFLALNTSSKDNELYYGTAICSGNANISGFDDQFIININATALKGTDFKIPLNQGAEVSNSDFLVFTNSHKKEEKAIETIDLSGIQLNFDLEIEPEAKLQIIFDEQIGDILEANGEGNLKLEINTLGNFNIFGQYVIHDGEYLFTLKNIVNKRFDLAKGSRISWDGDPYRARLDMRAIYNLRASLIDIMPEDTTGTYKRRVPVELELQMTGFLLSPEIAFDIRLPSADDVTRRRLESVLYVNNNDVNQQEMNQQVFGLLVLNRFMPPSTGSSAQNSYNRGAPGVNNGYEFLSNQMSNWLSQVSDQFDVGVNYRKGNEYTSDEVDVSLSTELFEDRLVLDGNLGYSDQRELQNENQSNFIGEFNVEYKLSKDGRLRLKAFNRSTNNSLLQTYSPYTQGVGLFYREEFDTFGELWRRYFSKDSKGREEEE